MQRLQRIIDTVLPIRRKVATGIVCLLALWMGYHAVFGPNGMMVYQRKKAEYKKIQQEIDQVQAENDKLQQQIKALKTDPKAVEKIAREDMRYTRPGEVVYVLPQPKPTNVPPASAQNHKP